ncbi:hypothetical protein C3943_21600 [Lysinibacillus sp. B2A1]|nr:hypothetical protein C3943_21600 [Lysinibacillus sp. B2A1]
MDIRKQFIQKKEELKGRFENAIALGNRLNEKYHEVLSIHQINENLQALQKNWESERFEIVVVGEFSTGKSTFINALLQREILPSKVTPTTATVNFIRHLNELSNHTGEPVAKVVFKDGKEIEIPYLELPDYVTEMSSKVNVSNQIHHVDLYVDSPYLENGVVLVDTPGLQALNPEHEKITKTQIKKSNASILLFNMEQPGKLTEIKFLRDLSDSIDRIFFVANRLDGVPADQVQEVKDQLEKALRENNYQQIEESRAVIYPLSALQALKARDQDVITKHWQDINPVTLLQESKFLLFEERLEQYLFDGEKTNDFLQVPFTAIDQFYSQLIAEFEQYQKNLENSEDLEELKRMHKLAKDEAELRKMQLKKEIIRLKNLFNDTIRANEKQFNEDFDRLVDMTKTAINGIVTIEELEDQVNDEMEIFNTGYQALFDSKIYDLSEELNRTMRKELNEFDVKVEASHQASGIHLQVEMKKAVGKSYEEILQEVTKQFEEKEQDLKGERAVLEKKIQLETELRYKREEKAMVEREFQEDIRFQEMLIQSTPQMIEKHGVIKKRRFFFDKEGFIQENNEKYDQLIAQKRELAKQKKAVAAQKLNEEKDLQLSLAGVSTAYSSHEEIREERRDMREQKNMAIMQRLNEQLNNSDQQLNLEKRKVIRQLEMLLNTTKREYREFLRELDALKLAEQKIEEHIKKQDGLLEDVVKRATQLSEQMANSQEARQNLAKEIEEIRHRIEEEKILLMTAMI